MHLPLVLPTIASSMVDATQVTYHVYAVVGKDRVYGRFRADKPLVVALPAIRVDGKSLSSRGLPLDLA